jgi:ABC-2 type transport system permease protein/oleandomycin transport system permease protein
MSTTAPVTALAPADRATGPRLVADAITVTWRNILNLRRNPQVLVFSTVQPVIFVLMFRYVFGGAINIGKVPGFPGPIKYVNYLMPGIFAQTIVFGAVNTAVGLADDLNKGLIDRFRSLPMARSAVLIGRTLADLTRNIFVVTLMVLVGFAVGFRYQTSFGGLLAGALLIFAFAVALSWVFATVGLLIGNAEAAQAASFPILAPLTFASSAFVSVNNMPGWLQPFARNQPVTVVIDAVRHLVLGGPTSSAVLRAVAWIVGIIAVFAPLAVARYRRS